MRLAAGITRLVPGLCLIAFIPVASAAMASELHPSAFRKGIDAYEAKHFKRARRIWARLAVKGDILAQYNLGILYSKGRGIGVDYDLAMKWFGTAAKSGFGPAYVNLANMYEYGLGTPKNPEMALAYLIVASAALPPGRCHETAIRQRQAIAAGLPSKAVLRATRKANGDLRPTESIHSFYSYSGECFSSIAFGGGTIRAIAQISGFRPPAPAVPDRSVASDFATRMPAPPRAASPREKAAKQPAVRRPAASPAQPEKPVAVARRSPEPSRTTGRWAYYAQLASLPTNEAAQRLQAKLRKRHAGTLGKQPMSIQEAQLEKLGTVYRLRVGPFGEKVAAKDLCKTLKEKRQACFVVRRAKTEG